MRNRKPVQSISLKYFLTRNKYSNLHKRITALIKDGSFYELTEKIRKNMWRRLQFNFGGGWVNIGTSFGTNFQVNYNIVFNADNLAGGIDFS
ncbi:MAG: hypothetical protein IIB83_08130 [Bacteroidetes bacterium]|nr:hypothetical protein [Bacteroidota bacterium]